MKNVAALYVFRCLWNCTEDTRVVGERLICYARSYAEHILSKIQDVHFVISSLTGVQQNAKKKSGNSNPNPVKPGISFIVCYTPSAICNEDTFVDAMHRIGLSHHHLVDMTAKSIDSRSKDLNERLLAQCSMALKDAKTPYITDLLKTSIDYTSSVYPDLAIPNAPTMVTLINPVFNLVVGPLCEKLMSLKFNIEGKTVSSHQPIRVYRSEPPKGMDKSVDIMVNYLTDKDLRIHNGYVYQRAPGSRVTFSRTMSVESFIHKSQADPFIAGNVSVSHLSGLIKFFGHPDYSRTRQLKIDEDLIEVQGGKCWNLSKMEFVDIPIAESDIGIISPRAFYRWNPEDEPLPYHFIEMIQNSFPDVARRNMFLCKWYQLLFFHRHQLKTPALLVVGPKDCGKTTLINPILELIPHEFLASITKENQFSTSSINKNTRLTFVDEFSSDRLSADQCKSTLQGGFNVTSHKHKAVDIFYNRSQFYLTANNVPNWGAEDVNVKRRLEIFEMLPLANVDTTISQWLTDHAFECILWAGKCVRSALDTLPRKELFFFHEPLPVSRQSLLVDNMEKMFRRPMNVVMRADDDTLSLFENDNDDEDDDDQDDMAAEEVDEAEEEVEDVDYVLDMENLVTLADDNDADL